ncbi:MAG TPA: GNAT family N-acetyltransferase [Candidatus Limnocylindria bacterium]|jgi:ribosomal protein S18 acetylase RimI-like enzyme|nr:GNAT family N-acetyltransferase [Candidatus Limnocylindria bacterium]
MATPPDLEIHPLSQERFADLASLFGEGGDPKWCWCAWYRLRNVDFQKATADGNRAVLERAVEATAAEDRHPGLVAYRNGEPIGWVSVGPRGDYERLQHSRVLGPIDDRPVWSIVCFVVSRRARGQGVARALLDAAVEYAAQHGARLLEAYPVDTGGRRLPAASAYKGTVEMFERAGFRVVERRRANRASPERPIVRREI